MRKVSVMFIEGTLRWVVVFYEESEIKSTQAYEAYDQVCREVRSWLRS